MKGSWLWLNNKTLDYDKWKLMKLDGLNADEYIYVVIDKADGTFIKAKKSVGSGKICEYKRKACGVNQTRWCSLSNPSTTTKLPTTAPTVSPATTQETITTTKITNFSTTNKQTTTSNNGSVLVPLPTGAQESKERSVKAAKKPFPILVFMIVLAVILLVCIGILIVVWISKSRKRGVHSISQRRQSADNKLDMSLDVRYMYDQYPEDFSDQGNAALPHEKLIANNISHVQTDTITYSRDAVESTSEGNGKVLLDRESVNDDIQETPKEERKIEKEVKEPNAKEDGESNVNLTTFTMKIEEEEEEDEEVFLTEEGEKQQQNDATGGGLPDESSSEIFTYYANINETENKGSTEALYTELNDADNEHKEKDVTYAEIVDFTANSSEPIKKPTPYYPTEYASVTWHPLSPRFETT